MLIRHQPHSWTLTCLQYRTECEYKQHVAHSPTFLRKGEKKISLSRISWVDVQLCDWCNLAAFRTFCNTPEISKCNISFTAIREMVHKSWSHQAPRNLTKPFLADTCMKLHAHAQVVYIGTVLSVLNILWQFICNSNNRGAYSLVGVFLQSHWSEQGLYIL